MRPCKTPIDDLLKPETIYAMDTGDFRKSEILNPAELKIEYSKINQKLYCLQAENERLYVDNERVCKGFRGVVLKFFGIKLRTKPPIGKVMKSFWRSCFDGVMIFLLILLFLWFAGANGTSLNPLNVAFVSLFTLFVSLFVNVFFPDNRSDVMRVLRAIGDIGAVSLVYATLKSIGINGFEQSYYPQVFLGLTYVFAAIKFTRDL